MIMTASTNRIEQRKINVLEWTRQSSDLNPVKNWGNLDEACAQKRHMQYDRSGAFSLKR